MLKHLNLLSIILIFLLVIVSIFFFNFYTKYGDLQAKNQELSRQVTELKTTASMNQEVYTKTEEYLSALMEGNAKSYMTESYLNKTENMERGMSHERAELEEIDIYNISVRQQEKGTYLVYAIYKASLGGVDVEVEDPSQYTTYFLMSKVTFVQENGELKVNNHDLRPIENSLKFFNELEK
ncbi:hypothetical protein [Halobacillus amylolyticus]|uniref:Uncharacterized protein n=1 Tax=Halobacillus amylolyticus TaxID=2932259 RepID=A0ABY4HGN0_9BACI|nr:hypothetical protein [Halobacillus amylolyticus]UOR14081.1 hypothetical protein MUO15_21230 [Halobacillus amylolyticus]